MTGQDFNLSSRGTNYVLTPITDRGLEWEMKHMPRDAIRFLGGVQIEPKYLWPVLNALRRGGMQVNIVGLQEAA